MRLVRILIGLAVIGAAVVLVVSAIRTSSARVAATTSSSSFFAAGVVELTQPDGSVSLLFDADGLYPGRPVEGCVLVEYAGSVPADIRLHGELTGGTGLERFVELTLTVADQGSCDTPTAAPRPVFSAPLDQLAANHANHGDGVPLLTGAEAGDRLVLRGAATLVDDNEAQGLDTRFSIVIEGRP